MKHKGFKIVIVVLAMIAAALFIFSDHMERVVKARGSSMAAPISIMGAASFDNAPVSAAPRLAEPIERSVPLATLMQPPESSYTKRFDRLATSTKLSDKREAYELVRKCLFTSAVQRDGIAEIERDCGDLETGRAAIVQDPAVRLKPLVECAQGGEHGCWAMLDQWESKWNGVFEGFDDTPENRKIIEEARQASLAHGDPAALFNESARAKAKKDSATALEMFAAGREALRVSNNDEDLYLPYSDAATMALAQGLSADVVRERIERGLARVRRMQLQGRTS